MARARWAGAARRRKRRLFKAAEGFRAGRKRLVRHATPSVRKSLVYARRRPIVLEPSEISLFNR